MDHIKKSVDRVRATFETGKTCSLEYRLQQLRALKKMIEEREADFAAAMKKDLCKSAFDCYAFEMCHVIQEINHMIKMLPEWMAPEHMPKTPATQHDEAYICYKPLGVVLVMSAWNYPFNLTIQPVVGVIAAGNCCVIKPSEISPHTAKVFEQLIPQYLDKDAFCVINGGIPETTKLLEQRFDHIMYTGSGMVGKIVMAAASKHLTPVTLELGGKSPVIMGNDCNLDFACKRLTWGKFLNSGQTCIAPDYVLCEPSMQNKIVELVKKHIKELYGEDPHKSSDYGRIVSPRHWQRLVGLLEGQNIACGGQCDESDCYIAPTVLTNVNPKSKVMQEEIFGPIMPIVCVKNLDEAIRFINSRDKPLALYMFSDNKKDIEKVLNSTCSGGFAVNDVIMHAIVEGLPFGGVGESGMGRYHGRHSFNTFSHPCGCLIRPMVEDAESANRYPPASQKKMEFFRSLVACKK